MIELHVGIVRREKVDRYRTTYRTGKRGKEGDVCKDLDDSKSGIEVFGGGRLAIGGLWRCMGLVTGRVRLCSPFVFGGG